MSPGAGMLRPVRVVLADDQELVATRLYAGSLLQTGARVRLRQAWSSAD